MNWDKYTFHCSSLANLMVSPRNKSELISETTKRFLEEIYIKEVYKRQKIDNIANKYMRKGTMCETDSLELVERVLNEKYFKNQKTLQNKYIVGTPDVNTKDVLIDIKTSWDLFTFARSNYETAKNDYYYQLLGYMWLTGKRKASLIYCLVNTPQTMVADELYRISYAVGEEEAEKYRNNFEFDDIPEKVRVKKFDFEINEDEIELLKARIKVAREYLKNISI